MSSFTVYIILQLAQSLLLSLVFTVSGLYQVMVVHLTPLQLVLIGTTLEATVFLFEIPTGVLADTQSRKLSIIVGHVLIGVGFIVEGSLPYFWTVALAQGLWGLGYTFTSGATEAWIVDEIGKERAGEAFIRGAQASRAGALVAIPISVLVATKHLALPIQLGGGCMALLAGFLAVAMTERGFVPTPVADRTTWASMAHTAAGARQLMIRQPVFLTLLAIGLIYGLYSEGLDRLWTIHLLDNFTIPLANRFKPVMWFGGIRAIAIGCALVATEVVRRSLDTRATVVLRRTLALSAGLLVVSLTGFGLTGAFWIAVTLFWLMAALRNITEPLYATWLNQRIDDPQVRATMFSIRGQVDALGQIAGGPALGAIGNLSIRAALVTSALILSPVLALYRTAARHDVGE